MLVRAEWLRVLRNCCLLMVVLGIALSISLCLAEEKKPPLSPKDKESYSLGFQFGEYLKKQEMQIDLETYTSGVRDGLAGAKPLLTQEEIRSTVAELQKRAMAARQKEQTDKAAKNLAEGNAFLEENGKKDGVTVLPSGLQYKVLKEGTGKNPTAKDIVKVHYRGTLIDGVQFDSSHDRGEPAKFKVGGVIKGWQEALQLMKEGSKWQLFIPSGLAYGERGGRSIGPNSTLIFEVELISIEAGE